jgi:NitT/TauT family transport system permease protein
MSNVSDGNAEAEDGNTVNAGGSVRAVWRVARGAGAIVAVLIVWEVIVRVFHVPDYLLPPPTQIFARMVAERELLIQYMYVTLAETVLGFALAVSLGVAAAILVTTSERIKDVVMPLIVVTQLVPKVAIAPLILIWFGYGIPSKIVMAFLIAFFPIVIDMIAGLTMVEKELVDLLRSLGASRWKIFVKAQIPNSLPFLFSGMRISITLAIIGAIVGEFVGGSSGLGYLIVVATSQLKTELVFASLVVLTIVGFALFTIVGMAERFFIPWSSRERDELLVVTGM